MKAVLCKSCFKLKTQKQTASKHFKSKIKRLNSRGFARNFVCCSDYSAGIFSAEHLFSKHPFSDACFIVN